MIEQERFSHQISKIIELVFEDIQFIEPYELRG